jgi:hypothetical protein
MRKKLLAILLCSVLLLLPILSVREQNPDDQTQPFFENGFFHDPLIPKIVCPPVNSSAVTSTISSATIAENIPLFAVNVLVAGDEEFLAGNYDTPFGVLGAFDYARFQIQRASRWLTETFSIGLCVSGFVEWDSDDTLKGTVSKEEKLLLEVINETGFDSVSPLTTILVAWSTQLTIYAGLAYFDGRACIVAPQVYWADDNLVQHEISHLFGAEDGTYEDYTSLKSDCYVRTCVMSYRGVYVDTVTEDGKVYNVQWEIPESLLTNIWCKYSQKEISHIFECSHEGGC